MKSNENVVEVNAEVIDEGGLLVSFIPASIEANFQALDEQVSKMIEGYSDAIYDLTDNEAIKQAKRDRTYLNGIVKEVDGRRKDVKRKYMDPYNEFDAKVNAIIKKVKDASANIKAQLDEAEEARKADLLEQLRQHYEDFAGILVTMVPYERIHDDKWLNKTFGLVKAQNAIEEKAQRIAGDWETLKKQESLPHYDIAERTFFETLDLGKALNAASEAQAADQRIAELKEEVEAIHEPPAPEPDGCSLQDGVEEILDCVPEDPAPMAPAAPVQPIQPQPEPAPAAPAPAAPQPPIPASQQRIPCVMVIEAASQDQMAEIGRFCGSLNPPVSGRFLGGTIDQAYMKIMQEEGGCHAQ